MDIIPLSKEHAMQVANLHIFGIPTGFISSLGLPFVTRLYEAIASSSDAFGFVHVEDGNVIGFIAFTTNLKNLYRSICRKAGFRFFLILLKRIFSWKTMKKVYETLFYPNRIDKLNLPDAELLSIVVSESARAKGIGRKLMRQGLTECSNRGIRDVKVLVADFNQPANRFYQNAGFQIRTQIENHGIVSNVYVVSTDHFEKRQV